MQRSRSSTPHPSSLELWYIVLFSVLVIIIGNSKLILERLGFIPSAHLIGQQISVKTLIGLGWIDNFKVTANVINLIIWGATGLVIYSILQAIVRGVRQIQYERDFDTRLFVHPQTYSHQSYWRHVIIDSSLGFVLMALMLLGAAGYLFILIPDSFLFVQRFIYSPDITSAFDPLVGLGDLCVGTAIMYVLVRLVVNHHRIATIPE